MHAENARTQNMLGNLYKLFVTEAGLTNCKIWAQTNYRLCNNDMEQLLSQD